MTKTKLKDQATNKQISKAKKLFVAFTMILSGILLYLDKIFEFFNITLTNNRGWPDTPTFIWSLNQTIVSILFLIVIYILAESILGWFKLVLLVPLYAFAVQLWFVLNDSLTNDVAILHVYVIGTMALTIWLTILLKRTLENQKSLSELKIRIMTALITADEKIIKQHEQKT